MITVDKYLHYVSQKDIDGNPDIRRDCVFPGWYYQDETENFGGGPYSTEEECRKALDIYTKYFL